VPTAVLDAVTASVLEDLASDSGELRVQALERIVSQWPLTTPALDGALAHEKESVRVEAARLLEREELGDQRPRLRRLFRDTSPAVRRTAVRAVRHLGLGSEEDELVRLMREDPTWGVRFEAVRTLEEVGTVRCLAEVLSCWRREDDDDRRRPFTRVLRRLTGEEHGADAEAWRDAVDRAVARARDASSAR